MKLTSIITAKIEPEIYKKILTWTKRFEVRDESFQNADFIRYVNANSENGAEEVFGIYRIKGEIFLPSNARSIAQEISAVDEETFDRLFPTEDYVFYVAELGEPITELSELFTDPS